MPTGWGYGALLTNSENVAIEFKRWMGQKDRKNFPAAQRELSAEELSAEVLKSLKEDVRRQAGTDVNAAVITVPAAFGALQCEATARAAILAGLHEAPLLQEPIAAAVGYGARPGSAAQRWLVFDLGGGTLDIAVVSTRDGRLSNNFPSLIPAFCSCSLTIGTFASQVSQAVCKFWLHAPEYRPPTAPGTSDL